MKIISLFTKAPNHQRFNYTPRFYDPKKEEMKEREERIKREIEKERGIQAEEAATGGSYHSRMRGAFHSARKRSKNNAGPNVVMLRLGVLMFISLFLFAFLTWGKVALYSLLLFVPFYFYLKFKKR